MRKNLIFLTELYPHQNIGGIFEKTEITNLAPLFEKIFVISSVSDKVYKISSALPANVIPLSFTIKTGFTMKLFALRLVFTSVFFEEITFIRRILKLKISFHIIGVLLVEYHNSIALSQFIKKILKRNNLDAKDTLLYSFWNNYRAIACAILKKENKNFAAVSRSHGGDVYYERHLGNYLPLKRFMLEHLDAVYTISDSSRDYLIKKLMDKSDKILSFKLGVKNNYTIEKYALADELIIASCSQMVRVKRLDLLIQGLKKLTDINFIWYHIGIDWLQGEIIRLAKAELKPLGLRFQFMGMMPNEELMAFYNIVKPDIFINTSKSEGIPVSVMEAMSFGIPVIATGVGGTPEIVRNNYNGYLLSEDPSPEEIAATIQRFYLLTIEEKLKMRENAFKTWKDEYNADKNYPDFISKIISL